MNFMIEFTLSANDTITEHSWNTLWGEIIVTNWLNITVNCMSLDTTF